MSKYLCNCKTDSVLFFYYSHSIFYNPNSLEPRHSKSHSQKRNKDSVIPARIKANDGHYNIITMINLALLELTQCSEDITNIRRRLAVAKIRQQ